jgi:hypothetical protein
MKKPRGPPSNTGAPSKSDLHDVGERLPQISRRSQVQRVRHMRFVSVGPVPVTEIMYGLFTNHESKFHRIILSIRNIYDPPALPRIHCL